MRCLHRHADRKPQAIAYVYSTRPATTLTRFVPSVRDAQGFNRGEPRRPERWTDAGDDRDGDDR